MSEQVHWSKDWQNRNLENRITFKLYRSMLVNNFTWSKPHKMKERVIQVQAFLYGAYILDQSSLEKMKDV